MTREVIREETDFYSRDTKLGETDGRSRGPTLYSVDGDECGNRLECLGTERSSYPVRRSSGRFVSGSELTPGVYVGCMRDPW